MWEYNNTDELYHYGILGMRWGRRKASYTSKDHRRAKTLKKKKLSQLSNNELKELNNRQNLETQYKKNNVSRGKKIVTGILVTAGTTAAAIGSYNTIKGFVNGDGKKLASNGKRIVDSLLKTRRI